MVKKVQSFKFKVLTLKLPKTCSFIHIEISCVYLFTLKHTVDLLMGVLHRVCCLSFILTLHCLINIRISGGIWHFTHPSYLVKKIKPHIYGSISGTGLGIPWAN